MFFQKGLKLILWRRLSIPQKFFKGLTPYFMTLWFHGGTPDTNAQVKSHIRTCADSKTVYFWRVINNRTSAIRLPVQMPTIFD